MQRLFNAEIFSRSDLSFLERYLVYEPQVSFDYLTLDASDISVVNSDEDTGINPGDYVRVIELEDGKCVFCGIVQSVEWSRRTRSVMTVSAVPLLTLLDVPLFRVDWTTEGETLEQFLSHAVADVYQNSGDPCQNLSGLEICTSGETAEWSLPTLEDAHDSGDSAQSINLWDLFLDAFEKYEIAAEMELLPQEKAIRLELKTVTEEVTIEADADYILDKSIVIGSDYGEVNKMIYYHSSAPEEQMVCYLYSDGTIGTDAEHELRITPVVWNYSGITPEKEDGFLQAAEEAAENYFTGTRYRNEIKLTFAGQNRLLQPETLKIGTTADIISGGRHYRSILSGWELSGRKTVLVFGSVREELTKKMILERKN